MRIAEKPARAETGSTPSIIKAARKLFLKNGYDGVNLHAIAKKPSVARQTLYNIFGSKEALFKGMLNSHWSSIAGRKDNGNDSVPPDMPAEELLRDFADRMLEFIDSLEQVNFTRLVIAESRHAAWIGHEFYNIGKAPLLHYFMDEIIRLNAVEILNCRNPNLATHQFFDLILGVTFWPYVMAIGPATSELPNREEAIDEEIEMFPARYSKAGSR